MPKKIAYNLKKQRLKGDSQIYSKRKLTQLARLTNKWNTKIIFTIKSAVKTNRLKTKVDISS